MCVCVKPGGNLKVQRARFVILITILAKVLLHTEIRRGYIYRGKSGRFKFHVRAMYTRADSWPVTFVGFINGIKITLH